MTSEAYKPSLNAQITVYIVYNNDFMPAYSFINLIFYTKQSYTKKGRGKA